MRPRGGPLPEAAPDPPAGESLGIDWFATLRAAGWDLRVYADRSDAGGLPPSYSLILVD